MWRSRQLDSSHTGKVETCNLYVLASRGRLVSYISLPSGKHVSTAHPYRHSDFEALCICLDPTWCMCISCSVERILSRRMSNFFRDYFCIGARKKNLFCIFVSAAEVEWDARNAFALAAAQVQETLVKL